MSKKKLCKWAKCGCMGYGVRYMFAKCGKNTNLNCEIIPANPKFKTIKFWTHPDIAITKNPMVWMAKHKSVNYSIPCEIRINTKYLKEKK